MPTLRIQLLGDFRLVYDDTPVTSINTARLQSLLAYLLLHREAPQSRQHLAFLLWPDSTEAQARTNLRKQLLYLRRALPDADRFLHTDTQTVQWRPDASFDLDVAAFESAIARAEQAEQAGDPTAVRAALEEAVGLYSGDLLPSCYDDWMLLERERLHQAFLRGLERLIELLEVQRNYGAAIHYSQRLLYYDPLHEAAYRRLMHLHVMNGDRAGALRVYQTCAERLEQGLGVEPSQTTQRLYKQLLGRGARAMPFHNLPSPLTSLVGRETEAATIQRLLRRDEVRLVTLTGPPGIGKTRLGLQVAADLVEEFEDGVVFIPLAPISDPDLVPSAMAQTLGVSEMAPRPLLESLQDYLCGRHLLLLLDNFEQVISAGPIVSELLVGCPALKVLMTSREVLRLRGEREFAVPPLSVPDLKRLPPSGAGLVSALSQFPAVQLFIQRVRGVNSDFSLDEDNALVVADICSRLDGLPLAIELAAARIKLLSPQAMLARLGSRLKLLTRGPQDLPSRHRTLRGAIAWSYDLLDADERALFRRLAVFVGGCTLAAAEAVCNPAGDLMLDVLDGLSSLLDKSLLQHAAETEQERFVMLETIREYGLERLEESGEVDIVRNAHAEYYLTLAEEAQPGLRSSEQLVWLNELAAEHENLRAALRWTLDSGAVETALQLAAALGRFWYLHGHLYEGRRWLTEALSQADGAPASMRAEAIRSAGRLAFFQCDYTKARALFEESLAIWRRLGDERPTAELLSNLGTVAVNQGDFATARVLYQEGLAIEQRLGDEWGIAAALRNLGLVAQFEGDLITARARYDESLAIFRQLRDRGRIAEALSNLGFVAQYQGDLATARSLNEEGLDLFTRLGHKRGIAMTLYRLGSIARLEERYVKARPLFEESLTQFRELGDRIAVAFVLEGLAHLAAAQGQAARAARLFGAADAMRQVSGAPLPPIDHPEYDRDLSAIRTSLGEQAYAAAWAEGQAMSTEQAIAYAHVPA